MIGISKLIDKRIAAYQNSLIRIHYAEVDNMYNQIRGWRHDYSNHMQVLKRYADDGDIDAIRRYLSALDDDFAAVDTVIKTGNKMADAILNSKISLARAKRIQVTADAHIPVALTITDIDLCIIIGNLMDNAIEATWPLPEPERRILCYMEMKNTQLYLSLTNTTAVKKQRAINGRFFTTKGDGHGFGLVRIDNIIERYGGYINRNSENGAFTTEVLLPQ